MNNVNDISYAPTLKHIMSINATSSLLSTLNSSYTTQSTFKPTASLLISSCKVTTSLENVLYTSLMSFILAASLFGNGLVVLAVGLSRQLRSRVTIYFVISLAFSDLILATFTIPFKISSKLHNHRFCHELAACYTYIISDSFGNIASILNLFIIAIDRFIAINIPYRYPSLVSKKKAKIYIAIIWVVSFVWSVGGIFRWDKTEDKNPLSVKVANVCANGNTTYYATSFSIYIIILLMMTCFYAAILCTAISQIKSINKSEVLYLPKEPKASTVIRFKPKLSREIKATKAVAIIYIAFLICWTPSAVINIILLIDNTYFYSMHVNNQKLFLFLYYFFVETLPLFNTMINPIIYSFSSKHFRAAFKNVLLPFMNHSKDLYGVSSSTYVPTNRHSEGFL